MSRSDRISARDQGTKRAQSIIHLIMMLKTELNRHTTRMKIRESVVT